MLGFNVVIHSSNRVYMYALINSGNVSLETCSVKDLHLSYFPVKEIGLIVTYIPGKTNPADALTKSIDLSVLVSKFMVSIT